MSREVAIFDLDSALLRSSPLPALSAALNDVDPVRGRVASAVQALYRAFDPVSGPLLMPIALRAALSRTKGQEDQLRAAGAKAASTLTELVAPYARVEMDEHREAGRRLVLTTVAPVDLVQPTAETLGFDAVVASGPRGRAVWGRGKLVAVRDWASANGASLRRSHAYAGSIHDAPLLADIGHPTAVDPDPRLSVLAWLRGWPTRSLDVPPGVLKLARRELQEWFRPFGRPGLVPNARFEFSDLDYIPSSGPAIVVANHRSYFDAVAVSLAIAQRGRSARFLGKREVFDAPIIGAPARWIGGIRVDRGTGSDEPLLAADRALRAGELIMLMPQGTIPRGPAFFEPELKGRWGAARLAAMSKVPVIPVGLWGTEKVWPRSSRLPRLNLSRRPLVSLRAGPEVELLHQDPDEDTTRIMSAIADLLPPEGRQRRQPSPEELALTYPPGYKGEPDREHRRRPGTDK